MILTDSVFAGFNEVKIAKCKGCFCRLQDKHAENCRALPGVYIKDNNTLNKL